LFEDLKQALLMAGHLRLGESLARLRRADDAVRYEWTKCPAPLSRAGKEALRAIRARVASCHGQDVMPRNPDLIVRTDASRDGAGGTVWRVVKGGQCELVLEHASTMRMSTALESSTAREAYA